MGLFQTTQQTMVWQIVNAIGSLPSLLVFLWNPDLNTHEFHGLWFNCEKLKMIRFQLHALVSKP